MQQRLFCSCGADPALAGLCRRCYFSAWRSRARFGGHRDRALTRDGSACRVCGAAGGVIVHHRSPGKHATALLATLCRPCHAALHHRRQPSGWWPPLLAELWAEQHNGPRQLALDLGAAIAETPAAAPAKAA